MQISAVTVAPHKEMGVMRFRRGVKKQGIIMLKRIIP